MGKMKDLAEFAKASALCFASLCAVIGVVGIFGGVFLDVQVAVEAYGPRYLALLMH